LLLNDEAIRTFKKVLDRYPSSNAAVSAGKAFIKISGQKKEGAR
jgi:TolA-binding protein